MKFFISGQIKDTEAIQHQMRQVNEAGHEITHDWTSSDVLLDTREAKLADLDESGIRAEKDIQGVVDSDVYVLSSDNEKVGKGMYVELGAALALHQLNGKPLVYIVGEMNHMSVFYLHPAVKHRDSIQEVINEIDAEAIDEAY